AVSTPTNAIGEYTGATAPHGVIPPNITPCSFENDPPMPNAANFDGCGPLAKNHPPVADPPLHASPACHHARPHQRKASWPCCHSKPSWPCLSRPSTSLIPASGC